MISRVHNYGVLVHTDTLSIWRFSSAATVVAGVSARLEVGLESSSTLMPQHPGELVGCE
jgi:hypothetical protein